MTALRQRAGLRVYHPRARAGIPRVRCLPAETAEGPLAQVKGSAITARIRYVRERFGEDGYRQLVAALSADERALIQGRILPHAWVPYDLFVDVNVEADRLFGKGD